MNTRRQFLLQAPIGMLAAAAACRGAEQTPGTAAATTPGAPPTFGTSAAAGPSVTAETFAAAEPLMQVQMTDAERTQAAANWRTSMAGTLERRVGPRSVPLDDTMVPASQWNPAVAGTPRGSTRDRFVRTVVNPGPLPTSDSAIAFAPVTQLARWIETRQLTSCVTGAARALD